MSRDASTVVCRVPGGDEGTRRLGIAMVFLARKAAHDPEFVQWSRAAVRDIPSKAHNMTARRILDWVRQNVKYRFDPLGLEWQQDPRETLLVAGQGDCNNMADLVAAMALALGYPATIRFVRSDKTRPDEVSHVYSLMFLPDGQGGDVPVALDSTQATAEPGWEPPHWGAPMDFDVASWFPATPEDQAWWREIEAHYARAGSLRGMRRPW